MSAKGVTSYVCAVTACASSQDALRAAVEAEVRARLEAEMKEAMEKERVQAQKQREEEETKVKRAGKGKHEKGQTQRHKGGPKGGCPWEGKTMGASYPHVMQSQLAVLLKH